MAFTSDMLTDEEVLNFLGIDYADDMIKSNISMMKSAAASFLNSSIGENGDPEDARAKMIALAVIADMYDNRTYNDYANKTSIAVRNLINDFSLQLRLEGRTDS